MTNDKIKELMEQSGLLIHLEDCMPGVVQWWGMDELMAAFVKLVREETIRECAEEARHYAFALDYRGNAYVRSRECQQAAASILALLERDDG